MNTTNILLTEGMYILVCVYM